MPKPGIEPALPTELFRLPVTKAETTTRRDGEKESERERVRERDIERERDGRESQIKRERVMGEGERESGKRRAVLREGKRDSDDRYNRRGTRHNDR